MNIFILAGEPSGDEYGAELMKQMQGQNSEIQFHGIGGPLMAQYGLIPVIVPLSEINSEIDLSLYFCLIVSS